MVTEPTVETAMGVKQEDIAPITLPRHRPKGEPQTVLVEEKVRPTTGTKIFNVATYGGMGLIGNELASVVVMGGTKEGKFLHKPFTQLGEFFNKVKANHPHLPEYTDKRMPTILFALIGGMFMVPPIKWLEDNKGSIVRKIDHWIKGDKAETDPRIVAAHAELDRAPKQSWSSLGKGRIVTVFSAIAADASFGWKNSLLAKALEGTKAEKFSSLDHIAEQAAQAITKEKILTPEQIKNNVKASEKFAFYENLTWLLTLSTSLTILFYASSKLIAGKEEKKKVTRQERKATAADGKPLADEAQTDTAQATETLTKADDKPAAKVSHVVAHEMLAAAPEQAAQL